MIKTGDRVRVRRVGSEHWVSATVDLVSANQQSLAVSADSGLGTTRGLLINPETRRLVLILLKERASSPFYQDIVAGSNWEVAEVQDAQDN